MAKTKYVPFGPDFKFDVFRFENAEQSTRLSIEMHLKCLFVFGIVGVVDGGGLLLERFVLKVN